MAVDADHGAVDPPDPLAEGADDPVHLLGRGVADGVGDVDGRGAGVDRRFHDPTEEVELRASGVLRRELDVGAELPCPLHPGDGPSHHFVLGHPQFELAVDRARGEENMDPRPFRTAEGLPGAVDVGIVATGQAADDRATDRGGDLPDAGEVARRRDREAGFDDVDPELLERLGDLHLLGEVHARPRRLLAVAEGGVEDADRSGGRHGRPRGTPADKNRGSAGERAGIAGAAAMAHRGPRPATESGAAGAEGADRPDWEV